MLVEGVVICGPNKYVRRISEETSDILSRGSFRVQGTISVIADIFTLIHKRLNYFFHINNNQNMAEKNVIFLRPSSKTNDIISKVEILTSYLQIRDQPPTIKLGQNDIREIKSRRITIQNISNYVTLFLTFDGQLMTLCDGSYA